MPRPRTFQINLGGAKAIIVCLLIFNILSVTAIYSSLHQKGEFIGASILYKQILWIGISWLCLILFSFINYRSYYYLAYYLYAANLLLLIAVHFFGKTVMGAQRWISIFGFTFQPSEISKIAIIIILARFFSSVEKKGFFKDFLSPLCLVTLNALVIFKQPDLGTALIILAFFLLMGLFSKVNKLYFVCFIAAGLIISPLAMYSLKDYQRKRLTVFLNPNIDPLGSGYTIIQSKIAIGSGKVFGKGFLAGTQNQFNFLPERHTDFIFTVIAEEWGLIGAIFLLGLYWFILKKIVQRLSSARDNFAYFLTLGISIFFFLHIFINIGMTLGILPVVGLPLIFLSYGGTNLLITYMLLGIFFNICRNNS
jgi:rod shape determining protein RodA